MMPRSERRRSPRGLTLIEVMITVAISSIFLAAAVAVGTSLVGVTRGSSRRGDAETQLALALAVLDRQLANTGMGFSNPTFAFRVYDNVPAGSVPNLDGATTTPVVAYGAATQGIVSGTDIIEVSMADLGLRRPGTAASFSGCSGAGPCSFTLQTADPFLNAELGMSLGSNYPIILIQDDLNPDTQYCFAQVQGVTNTLPPTVTYLPIDKTFASDSTGGGCGTNTNHNPSVYLIERRARFFVWQKGAGVDLGLYMATSNPLAAYPMLTDGTFPNPAVTPPTILAQNIENLQVRLTIGPRFDGTNNGLGGCTATTAAPCRANGLGDPVTVDVLAVAALSPGIAFTRSALVELTARSNPEVGQGRPASMNLAAGPIDGYRRVKAGATAVLMLNGGLPNQ